jgi:hypothetical protein
MKRHPFDPASFLVGIALSGMGTAILTESLTLTPASIEWLVPGFAIALGCAVLLSIPRANEEERTAEPSDEERWESGPDDAL